MFPDMPKTTSPDVIAVVALADPVVLRRMVTSGLDELRRISTEGMQICGRVYKHMWSRADREVGVPRRCKS